MTVPRKRMTLCIICNGGHYDKVGNGKCSRCRSNDKQKERVALHHCWDMKVHVFYLHQINHSVHIRSII